jgi:hypothetical protein
MKMFRRNMGIAIGGLVAAILLATASVAARGAASLERGLRMVRNLRVRKARLVRGFSSLALALGMLALVSGPASAAPAAVTFALAPAAATLNEVLPDAHNDVTNAFYGSGSGDDSADIQPVNVSSDISGCDPADYADFAAGRVALLARGGCSFSQKVANAEAAGASAVIIFNSSPNGLFQGTLGSDVSVPAVAVSYSDGSSLAAEYQAAVADGIPLPVVEVQVPSSPGSLALSYTVNRAPNAIASLSCSFDSAPLQSCGNRTASSKGTTTYTVLLPIGPGSDPFAVTVRFTDRGSVSASYVTPPNQ